MITLKATKRTEEVAASLRENGQIPAVVYGPKQKAVAVAIVLGEFEKMYRDAGRSTIIELDIEGEEEAHDTLVKDIQYDAVTDTPLHVDFYAIERGKEMELNIPIEFVGESEASKKGGVLSTAMFELSVRCLPRNIPANIEVDLSAIEEIGDNITVGDIKAPEGVTILDEMESTIAGASEAKEEVEETPEEDAEAMAEVLADKSEGAEGEEGAEGKDDKKGE